MRRFNRVFSLIIILCIIAVMGIGCTKEPDVIKIGAVMPLTGPLAWLGQQHRWGLDIAVKDINSKGGINGKRIEIVYEDDGGDPKTAVSAFNLLVLKHNVPLVFVVMSSSALAVQPVAEKKQVVLFANVGHPKVAELSKWTFRIFLTSQQEASFMAKFCNESLSIEKLAVLYVNDAYGEAGFNVFKDKYTQAGGRIVISERYSPKSSEFRTEITKILSANPEAVYVLGYGKSTANLLNQLRELNYRGVILGTNNFSGPPISEIASVALEGSIFTAPYFYSNMEDNKQLVEFMNTVKRSSGKDPQWNTVVEYDALHIVAKALKNSANYTGDKLRSNLDNIRKFKGLAGEYNYSNTGEWLLDLVVLTYEESKQIPYGRNK